MPRINNQIPIIDMERTGKNIHSLVVNHGFTAKDIQSRLILASHQSVYHWFNGRSLPSIDNLIVLAKLLEVPLETIIITEDECMKENLGSHFIEKEEIPFDDYEMITRLMKKYNIPYHDLLRVYEHGFNFCCMADE